MISYFSRGKTAISESNRQVRLTTLTMMLYFYRMWKEGRKEYREKFYKEKKFYLWFVEKYGR